MPKMKTNRGAAKRFKRNGNGQYKRAAANRRHILTKKGQKRKRNLRGTRLVGERDHNSVARMMGDK